MNLTHTRGAHTFKAGLMREREAFGQARSGIFAGEFNFRNDARGPEQHRLSRSPTPSSARHRVQESLGRRPDNRRQNTWAWFVQDTWKPTAS